jgi:hypothetical protein
MTISEFWANVQKGDGCWLWTGAINGPGYGSLRLDGQPKSVFAHRLAWQLANGAMPNGLVLHKCDNPRCVNPDHLFIGTYTDNQRDCVRKGRHFETRKTHCKRGHEFKPENTYYSGRQRVCRLCDNARRRRGPRIITHCKYGHELTEENTERYLSGGYVKRRCLPCDALFGRGKR